MSIFKCEICGKSSNEEGFHIDEKGHPLWWIDPRFHSEIKQPVYFCDVYHSTEWYNKNMLKKVS